MANEVALNSLVPPAEYLIYPEDDLKHPRALFIYKNEERGYKEIVAKYFDPETKLYYNDDSKKKLYTKQVGLIVQAACVYGLRTAYHLSCLGILVELGKTLIGGQKKTLSERIVRELVKMVKSPLYGIAIVVISLSSVIFSPFKGTYVYTARKLIAKIEYNFNIDGESELYAARCFQPYQLKDKNNRTFLEGAAKSAMKTAKYRHKHCDPCNNFGRTLDKDIPYRSAILTQTNIDYALNLPTASPAA